MASFIVEGNHRLHGEIVPQGAKNEALEVICATMLTTEEVVIEILADIVIIGISLRVAELEVVCIESVKSRVSWNIGKAVNAFYLVVAHVIISSFH